MQCPVCEAPILPEEATQDIPVPQRVRLGPKSGLPGFYPHEDFPDVDEKVTVHYPQCCMGFFEPDNNPYIYESMVETLREQLTDEVRAELIEELRADFDRVKQMVGEKNYQFCVGCWSQLEEEEVEATYSDDPQCLWCKLPDHVWTKVHGDENIHYCGRCQKYWNQYEEEIAA